MDKPKTVIEHLEELRRRLLTVIISFLVLVTAAMVLPSYEDSFATKTLKFLGNCFLPELGGQTAAKIRLIFIDPLEPFMAVIKVSVLLSLIIMIPFIFYQVFAYISPALKGKKRGLLAYFLFGSIIFFAFGACISFFLLIPVTFKILVGYGLFTGAVPQITLSKFINYVMWMFLLFSLPFELPLVIGLLSYAGILTSERLRKIRKGMYAGIVIFSAAITPDPTPFSMLILSACLILLYELGIIIASFFKEKKAGRRKK
jgi:sec-independent protein translocase protein TatC